MKSEYFVLLLNDTCCSLQNFAAIALKSKNLWRKFVTAKCSSINYGATLTTSQNDEHQQKRLDLNDSKLGDKLLNNTSPTFSEGVCETKTEDPRPKTDDPIFN